MQNVARLHAGHMLTSGLHACSARTHGQLKVTANCSRSSRARTSWPNSCRPPLRCALLDATLTSCRSPADLWLRAQGRDDEIVRLRTMLHDVLAKHLVGSAHGAEVRGDLGSPRLPTRILRAALANAESRERECVLHVRIGDARFELPADVVFRTDDRRSEFFERTFFKTEGGRGVEQFHAACAGRSSRHPPGDDGCFTLQRDDPVLFALVMRFMRTGEVPGMVLHSPELARLLLAEAQFFGIEGLQRVLDAELGAVQQQSWAHESEEVLRLQREVQATCTRLRDAQDEVARQAAVQRADARRQQDAREEVRQLTKGMRERQHKDAQLILSLTEEVTRLTGASQKARYKYAELEARCSELERNERVANEEALGVTERLAAAQAQAQKSKAVLEATQVKLEREREMRAQLQSAADVAKGECERLRRRLEPERAQRSFGVQTEGSVGTADCAVPDSPSAHMSTAASPRVDATPTQRHMRRSATVHQLRRRKESEAADALATRSRSPTQSAVGTREHQRRGGHSGADVGSPSGLSLVATRGAIPSLPHGKDTVGTVPATTLLSTPRQTSSSVEASHAPSSSPMDAEVLVHRASGCEQGTPCAGSEGALQ